MDALSGFWPFSAEADASPSSVALAVTVFLAGALPGILAAAIAAPDDAGHPCLLLFLAVGATSFLLALGSLAATYTPKIYDQGRVAPRRQTLVSTLSNARQIE